MLLWSCNNWLQNIDYLIDEMFDLLLLRKKVPSWEGYILEIWWCFLILICCNRSADKPLAIASLADRIDELWKVKSVVVYFPHCNLCCLMLWVGWLERQSLQGVANDENSFWLKLFSPADCFSFSLLLAWETCFLLLLRWFGCFTSDSLLFRGICRKLSKGTFLGARCRELRIVVPCW